MKYQAKFGIDCGISHGFGIKYPDYIEKEEIVIAEDEITAMKDSIKKALYFSRYYLSNPESEYTTVTLLELCDDKKSLINQKKVLKAAGFSGAKGFEWIEDKLVTKCHMLEHLLIDYLPHEN